MESKNHTRNETEDHLGVNAILFDLVCRERATPPTTVNRTCTDALKPNQSRNTHLYIILQTYLQLVTSNSFLLSASWPILNLSFLFSNSNLRKMEPILNEAFFFPKQLGTTHYVWGMPHGIVLWPIPKKQPSQTSILSAGLAYVPPPSPDRFWMWQASWATIPVES